MYKCLNLFTPGGFVPQESLTFDVFTGMMWHLTVCSAFGMVFPLNSKRELYGFVPLNMQVSGIIHS